ncbi:hypothetical protein PT974_10367 [Cladobotryum mycophilum]|uniref:Uncharacterized protein n=1 Tax=Cladobotryum mycophilum TaxID=491253 RepID=A0ABR0S9N3_9HYPO
MVFGERIVHALVKYERTYHFAPNLDMRPFPDGPLELGTVVEDIREFAPLNHGDDRVPIPEGQSYSDNKHGITYNASEVDRLETTYFYPNSRYLAKCVELGEVKSYLEETNYTSPLYLVTGLKIVHGATIVNTHEHQTQGGAGIGARIPLQNPALIDMGVGVDATANVMRQGRVAAECTEPANFIVGIQVQKMYYKQKNLFNKEKVLKKKRFVSRRMLLASEIPMKRDDEEGFVVSQLEDDDMQGMQCVDVDGEVWILPSDMD